MLEKFLIYFKRCQSKFKTGERQSDLYELYIAFSQDKYENPGGHEKKIVIFLKQQQLVSQSRSRSRNQIS